MDCDCCDDGPSADYTFFRLFPDGRTLEAFCYNDGEPLTQKDREDVHRSLNAYDPDTMALSVRGCWRFEMGRAYDPPYAGCPAYLDPSPLYDGSAARATPPPPDLEASDRTGSVKVGTGTLTLNGNPGPRFTPDRFDDIFAGLPILYRANGKGSFLSGLLDRFHADMDALKNRTAPADTGNIYTGYQAGVHI